MPMTKAMTSSVALATMAEAPTNEDASRSPTTRYARAEVPRRFYSMVPGLLSVVLLGFVIGDDL